MAKRKKKDEGFSLFWTFVIIGIAFLFVIGYNNNWFRPQSSGVSNTQSNYYCCSSSSGYSCNLNSCPSGSSKVYPDSFNTLSGCNSKCVTPTVFQPQPAPVPNQPVQQTQTCQQIAEGLGAFYKNSPVSSAKECSDFAKLDCADIGKIIDGYGVQGNCCYFTCIGIVTPDPVICSNTDSGFSYPFNLQTTGACTDDNGYVEDTCVDGMLEEYYCEPGINNGPATCGHVTYNCAGVIPGTTCQNGRCV